ncbi:MAG: tocopherol cyclase family protein [Myxococcota bacterium]
MGLTPAEADALIRYRPGGNDGHVESLFLELDLGQGRGLWLRYTLWAPTISGREAQAAVWAVAFGVGEGGEHVALRETTPTSRARFETESLYLRVGECELRQGRATGTIRDEGGGPDIAWDLSFPCEHEGFRHLPAEWMYGAGWPSAKAATPQIDARFSGTVRVGETTLSVRDAPGLLGHNWGKQHPQRWQWLHCNAFEGAPGVALEVLSAKTGGGRWAGPALSVLHLRLPGERITVGPVRGLWATRVTSDGLACHFSARTGDRRVEGEFSAAPQRFVGVDYTDPSGRIAHCVHTKIADGVLRVYAREDGAWRETLSLVAQGCAALEHGTRGDTHGVRIRIR